jgi:hypothetical protein
MRRRKRELGRLERERGGNENEFNRSLERKSV